MKITRYARVQGNVVGFFSGWSGTDFFGWFLLTYLLTYLFMLRMSQGTQNLNILCTIDNFSILKTPESCIVSKEKIIVKLSAKSQNLIFSRADINIIPNHKMLSFEQANVIRQHRKVMTFLKTY